MEGVSAGYERSPRPDPVIHTEVRDVWGASEEIVLLARGLHRATTIAPIGEASAPVCICGHPETAHTMSGRCRVPGCPCEHYEPVPEIRI